MKGQYDMERRKITWKDVALILLGIVLSGTGFAIKDLYAKVETKVDKTQFYNAIETMNKNFTDRSDLIIMLIKQHSEESKNE